MNTSVQDLLNNPYAYLYWSERRQQALSYVIGVLLKGDGTVCVVHSK